MPSTPRAPHPHEPAPPACPSPRRGFLRRLLDRRGRYQGEWDRTVYQDSTMSKNPAYNELQEQVVACAPPRDIRRVLELGTGTGETARRVISKYPRASLV